MTVKVYKRTDSSRDIPYQDALLSRIFPDWKTAPCFFDEEIQLLTRRTTRREKDEIYTASLALFADTEGGIKEFLQAIKKHGHKIICAEESLTWSGGKPVGIVVAQWRDARKAGASMRGAIKSAATRRARTAERFALIADRWPLPSKDYPAHVLLKEAGIRSINTVNNLHIKVDRNGNLVTKTREKFQAEYQAAQKRKARKVKK